MSVKNIVYYTCTKYAAFPDVGKERIQYTLYLTSWKTSLNPAHALHTIHWFNGKDGPYSPEIENHLNEDTRLQKKFLYIGGKNKERFSLSQPAQNVYVEADVKAAIDAIYEITYKRNFTELTDLVFSTYPLLITELGREMDLPTLAKIYVDQKTKTTNSRIT